jgi:Family of unknown function (DUF6492)
MRLTRIMCVGPGRLIETMVTLKFDYQIHPGLDQTYIISPYSEQEFRTLFKEFNINDQLIEILPEDYFDQYYDLSRWAVDNWYKQQAFKLCALDHFDSDYFLIQDCDLILLKPYSVWISGNLNFKAETLWNDYHTVYADMVEKIIGMKRAIPCSLVNELMPYSKQDWLDLKVLIGDWINTIPDARAFDSSKWFSEYELLGIYKTNQTGWQHFVNISQPPIYTWDDFYNTDWTKQSSIKFHARPLKFMNKEQAHKVLEFLNDNS